MFTIRQQRFEAGQTEPYSVSIRGLYLDRGQARDEITRLQKIERTNDSPLYAGEIVKLSIMTLSHDETHTCEAGSHVNYLPKDPINPTKVW